MLRRNHTEALISAQRPIILDPEHYEECYDFSAAYSDG